MTVLSYTNAFPGIPFPNKISGDSQPQSYLYPGAAQPQKTAPTVLNLYPTNFNPASLITGAGGFWRADTGVSLSGSNVTAWADQSSFGTNLAAGGGNPTYSSTGFLSSKPGITFSDGSFVNLSGTLNFGSATLTLFMLVFVANHSSNRACGIYQSGAGSDSSTPAALLLDTGTQLYAFSSGIIGNSGNQVNVAAGAAYLFGLTLDGANANVWLNGVIQGGASSFSSSIGGGAGATVWIGSSGFNGAAGATYAFWGITERTLNAIDWANLVAFANSNFGTGFAQGRVFPNIAFPQHGSGLVAPLSYMYPGAVQPIILTSSSFKAAWAVGRNKITEGVAT